MRRSFLPLVSFAALLLASCQDPGASAGRAPAAALATVPATLGSVERLDPALDALVPADAKLEVIAQGFTWVEGPLWVPASLPGGGCLLFSDIPPNRVMKWQAGRGVSVFLAQSGYLGPIPRPGFIAPDEPGSNGLLLDAHGQLILCQHGNRQVARMDAPLTAPAPRFVALAERYQGERFNSPNDGVFHRNGDLYITDPPYGLTRKMEDPEKKLPFQGVYRIAVDGTVTLLTKVMSRPNGIAFAPDYKTLYVANSDPGRAVWMAFPVNDDGTLGEGRVFYDAGAWVGTMKGLPDGMKVDRQGNLFATGPGGVRIFSPAGRLLGSFLTGQATSNCAFGEDGRTLFITADTYVLRVRLTTTGMGF
jgi:gluconolactonase